MITTSTTPIHPDDRLALWQAARGQAHTERAASTTDASRGRHTGAIDLVDGHSASGCVGRTTTNPAPVAGRRTRVTGTYHEAARRYGSRRFLRPAGWVGRLFRFLDDCRVIFFAAVAVTLLAYFIAEPMMRITYPEPTQCKNHYTGQKHQCSRIELPRLENDE